jgi:hypothetical protein
MTAKINSGSDLLIPRNQWVPESEIQGRENKVLHHPMVEQAFRRIIDLHKPKHKVCLVSLCTSTRPYSKSRKWSVFKQHFGDKADLIICSNGGIIPIEFEECYPYMTYDAHGMSEFDNLYIRITYERLMKFFSVHHYDRIIFNFRPNLRNRKSALMFKKMYRGNSEILILPTQLAYDEARKRKFAPYGGRYPDLSYIVLDQLKRAIER